MPAHLVAEEGPFKGLVIDLEQGAEWIIGRDPDTADYVVDDSTVSRRHARLTKGQDGIYLKNLSRVNPTLVNGEKVSDTLLLKESDRVQIGNTLFIYSEHDLPETAKFPPKKEKKKNGYDNIFGDIDESTPESEIEREDAPQQNEESDEKEPSAYDTIFDDTEEEEELPFNLISETPLILKVIAGPNAGAEIGIEKGRIYTLGKDPTSADIVFQDLSVSRNHARLTVTADGIIHIEDLGSKNGTVVNGVPITGMKDITPQDLVALGTTVFLIIDREAPQETIYSPSLSHIEPPTIEPISEEIPEPEEKQLPALTEEKRDWKREKIPTKHLIAAASFAAIFLIVFMSFFSLFKTKGIDIKEKDPTDIIKQELAKFEGVQFSYNPGSGKLFLVGHVLTAVEYQELRYRISQIEFITSTEDTVVIDEGVSRMMNDVLTGNPNWRSVNIRAAQPGKFIATGYLQNSADMAALSDYLNANFPYTDRLENRVVSDDTLNAELQSLLTANGFGAVSVQLNNGDLILTGRYSNRLQKEFEKLEKQIRQLNGITSFKNLAVATSPEMAAIDVTQQYVVGGSSLFDGKGYSAVVNGKIYTLGDAIDGMKITSILQNAILLEKDGIKYKIDYTR